MKEVRNWFTNGNDGIYYDICEDDGRLKAKTDTIKRWLLLCYV